jgi:hypothetical protein
LSDCGLESVKSHVQNIMPPIPFFSRRLFLGQTLATVLPLSTRAQPAPDGFRVLEARKNTLQLLPEPAGVSRQGRATDWDVLLFRPHHAAAHAAAAKRSA